MGRKVTTRDASFERAYSSADAMRESMHRGLRLGAIIDALEKAREDARVQCDFGGFVVTGVDSYRGHYSDIALSYSERDGLSAGELLALLRDADGKEFEGYKGGKFKMDRATPVWVANYGRSHGVAVVGVEDRDWRVVIHTAMIG